MRETKRENSWPLPPRRLLAAALLITLLSFLARLWTAHGTFLSPDEALHFRLANQPSLVLAYKQSLTCSHPPLLFLLLYLLRILGTSEICLRLPSVLAGTLFCWVFFRWLAKTAGAIAGFIGLLFAALLPPIVQLGAEVRQYALLIAFLASAVYFLDEALEKNSSCRMAASTLCLCLALLSHYSAALFIAALGIYALFRIATERSTARLAAAWIIGQLVLLALAMFFYKTHLSKLGGGEDVALHGWMSEYFLRHSYVDRAHDNPILFLAGHSFGIFQYFFGQLAVGDVMGLLFLVGVAQLLRGKASLDARVARRVACILILPFAMACIASLAHVYPYGGTRHMAFLVIPAIAGVSVAIARLASEKWSRGVAVAIVVLMACIVFYKPRHPWMTRADQSRAHMADAVNFIRQNVRSSDVIFTDYESDLILGHYLCGQQPIALEPAPAGFEQFSCAGHRIIGEDFREWAFAADHFTQDWQDLMHAFAVKPGAAVWVWQAGWDTNLAPDLQKNSTELHDLRYQAFGKNIKVFKLTAGEHMPAVP